MKEPDMLMYITRVNPSEWLVRKNIICLGVIREVKIKCIINFRKKTFRTYGFDRTRGEWSLTFKPETSDLEAPEILAMAELGLVAKVLKKKYLGSKQ